MDEDFCSSDIETTIQNANFFFTEQLKGPESVLDLPRTQLFAAYTDFLTGAFFFFFQSNAHDVLSSSLSFKAAQD